MGLLIYPAVYGTDPALGFGVGPCRDAAAGVPGTAGLCQEKPPRFAPSRGPRGGANPTRPRHPSPPRAGQTDGQTEGGTEGRRRRLPARGGGTTSPVKLRRPPAAAGLYKREWPGCRSPSISGRGGAGSRPLSPATCAPRAGSCTAAMGTSLPAAASLGGTGFIRAQGVGATCPDPRSGLWIWRMRRMLPGAPGVFRRWQPQRGERPSRGRWGEKGTRGGRGLQPSRGSSALPLLLSPLFPPPLLGAVPGGGWSGCGTPRCRPPPPLPSPDHPPCVPRVAAVHSSGLRPGDAPRSGGELGGEGESPVPVSGENG